MTVSLCSKTCAKGPLHWLWFYLPTFTLILLSLFLYLVWLCLYILPKIRREGMNSSNQLLGVVIAFHVLFFMYCFCLFRTWSTPAGKIPEVQDRVAAFVFSAFQIPASSLGEIDLLSLELPPPTVSAAFRADQIFKRKEFAFGDEGPYKMTPAMKAVLNRVKDITLTADKMVRNSFYSASIARYLLFRNYLIYLYSCHSIDSYSSSWPISLFA